jgi:hypothetical protein
MSNKIIIILIIALLFVGVIAYLAFNSGNNQSDRQSNQLEPAVTDTAIPTPSGTLLPTDTPEISTIPTISPTQKTIPAVSPAVLTPAAANTPALTPKPSL